MSTSSSIDPKIRCLVLYQDAQWTAERISNLLKTPVRTIRDWIKKINEGIDITEIKSGRGSKPKIQTSTKENLIRKTRRNPLTSSLRNLSNQYQISRGSTHNVLTERGFRYKSVQKKKTLDGDQKNERIDYCQTMLKRRGKPLEEVFFADETGIKLSEAYKSQAWTSPRKKVKKEVPARDMRLNCWGAISAQGATSLFIYKENLTAEMYTRIVEDHQEEMKELYPNGIKYIHDNLKLHKTAEVTFIENGFDMIKFPPYSPDLSPIENLWRSLKSRVSGDSPRTEAQLRKSLEKHWKIITEPKNLEPYFENLADRYRECVKKKGERLPH